MDVVLLPGLWHDAPSGEAITSLLERAGHRVHPLVLPREQSEEAERAGVTLRFRVDSLVMLLDSIEAPVVVVAPAGQGAVTDATVGARPGRVTRIVSVTGGPVGDPTAIDDGLPAEDDDIVVLDWSAEDVASFEDALLAPFREAPRPEPPPSRAPMRPGGGKPPAFPDAVDVDLRTGGPSRPPGVEDLGRTLLAALS